MRKPIIAGNWKMNKTIDEAVELAKGIRRELYNVSNIDIVLCPPFTALSEVNKIIKGSNIDLGAQDMYWEREGAWTGEVSPDMLKDSGARFVIIGHSERRTLFGETDEAVNRKVKSAINCGLIPIMCIGESLDERESGQTFKVIERHIKKGLSGLGKEWALKIVIAYEPVWAIGTGKTATPEQAQEAHSFIRDVLSNMYNEGISSLIRLQYGGSVNSDNIEDLMKEDDIDGALVGGASLKLESFIKIVRGAGVKYSERSVI